MNKNKIYLGWIWVVYIVGFIALVFLGIFSESSLEGKIEVKFDENTITTLFFLVVIFIIFRIAKMYLKRGESMAQSLRKVTEEIETLAKEKDINVLEQLLNNEELFDDVNVRNAFDKFKDELQDLQKSGANTKIDIEKYINEELLEDSISTHFLNQIAGAMTGFGILGTFIGLTIGLNSFNLGGTSDVIEKEIQPLMEGIKVAFHTSIVGIIYSLGFNLIYRNFLSKMREDLYSFLDAFEKYVIPDRDNGGIATSIIYQEKMISLLEQQLEQQKACEQLYKKLVTEEVEKINKTINTKLVPELSNIDVSIGKIANETTEEMNRSMRELLIPEIQKTSIAVEKFTTNTQKDQHEELARIVDSFIVEMNHSLGNSFKELGEVIDETNKWQKETLSEFNNVLEQIKSMGIDLGSVNQSLESSVNNINSFTNKIEQLQDRILTNLMNVNVQVEISNQAIEKQSENLSQIVEHEQSINETMIQFAQQVDTQTKTLKDIENNVNEYAREQLKQMAEDSRAICEELEERCEEYIKNLTENSISNVEKLQGAFTLFDGQIQNNLNRLASYKNELAGDISIATEKLEVVVKKLSNDMDARAKETFITFDKELAEIVKHFSGTLMSMEKELTKVPKVIDGVYGDMDEKFDKMQILLDQYLEYTNKLYQNIELKWQQVRTEETKEEINAQ